MVPSQDGVQERPFSAVADSDNIFQNTQLQPPATTGSAGEPLYHTGKIHDEFTDTPTAVSMAMAMHWTGPLQQKKPCSGANGILLTRWWQFDGT